MGIKLFKKIGKEQEKITPVDEPKPAIDPTYVVESGMKTSMELERVTDMYNQLVTSGKSFSKEEYTKLLASFKILAREFEKIYALMEFDHAKMISLEKYSAQTDIKRRELLKTLNEETPTGATNAQGNNQQKDQSQK